MATATITAETRNETISAKQAKSQEAEELAT